MTLKAKWISAARAKAATFDAELIPSGNQLEGAILQKCRVLSKPRQERASTLVFATPVWAGRTKEKDERLLGVVVHSGNLSIWEAEKAGESS